MDYRAKAKYVRVSPKKVARYLNMVRGADTETAMAKLEVLKNRTASAILKVIKSASAQGAGKLFVKKIYATPGPALKRMRPGAFGRAHMYKRRMSHINVEVGEAAGDGAGR